MGPMEFLRTRHSESRAPLTQLAAIALLAIFPCFAANDVSIAADGMLIVNGDRTFVLGLYENPKDDAILDEATKAGINLIQSTPDTEQLDRLHNRGVYAWINVGSSIDLSADTDTRKASLKKLADDFAAHPSLLVWEVPDEALWNVWYGAELWRNRDEPKQQEELIAALEDKAKAEKLRAMRVDVRKHRAMAEYKQAEDIADAIWRELGKEPPNPELNTSNAPERAATMAAGMLDGYTHLKSICPTHPVWMNHAPRNSVAQRAAFNKAADAVGCDIYPVPPHIGGHSDLADRGLTSVGAFTRLMQDAAPGKPVWMVLQAFSWAELAEKKNDPDLDQQRHPTYHETRFMAYDAIVNGARAILYWGSAYTDRSKPFWGELLKVVRELADLQPVLSAPDADVELQISLDETWGSLDQGIRVLPKETNDGTWLIVVNEWHDPLRYTIAGLNPARGATYTDTITGASVAADNGTITLSIPSYGVQVLRPSK
ncbi:MAG: hypothetical protein HUU46_15405 [Candidatus Hydrogenedentes bacterium]|nr:hypothetical protein [Candidatus Hydrogenedentota bacterium]